MLMEVNNNKVIWGGYRWYVLTEKRLSDPLCLERYGYKAYSQNDEDGIIEEIFNRIGTTNKTFVEFGVEDGLESNGHLLLYKGWKGLWIEGNSKDCEKILNIFRPAITNNQLKIKNLFITKDNINQAIEETGITGEIDLLSVDIDGNDYYVWEAINVISPRVVVVEYNGKFPPSVNWKQAYNEKHVWHGTDWQGASLTALDELGRAKGYQLVGTTINGVNAFFVKKELCAGKFYGNATPDELFTPLRAGELGHRCGHKNEFYLGNQTENAGLLDYYPEYSLKGIDKVIIFGAGQVGKRVAEYVREKNVEIVCFVDNNQSRHGDMFFEAEIKPVSFVSENRNIPIIIAMNKVNGGQAEKQLKEMKIDNYRVFEENILKRFG